MQILPADPWLRWAVLVAASLAVVSTGLMLQVLLLSEISARRERRHATFDRRWLPRLAAASVGAAYGGTPGADELAGPSHRDRVWFLMAWCRLQLQLRGVAHEHLNGLLRRFGLDVLALGLLDHRRGSMQLLGLACLRHLADPAHWARLADMVRDARPLHSLAAAEALVAVDAVRAMALVVPLAAERLDWATSRVVMLGRQAGPEALTGPLLEVLGRPLPPDVRTRLHALLPFGDPAALAPLARDTLANDAPAFRTVSALTVLGLMRDPRDRERFLPALGAADAAVRLAAIRALQGQATSGDLHRLAPLLCDRDWSVRQGAADAIASLPGLPPGALAALRERTTDRYGRDALDRAMAEQSS